MGGQSRKALRALKGLVKLQALVRGYLVRKQANATLHSMQALIRAQASVRSQRARRSFNKDHQIPPQIQHRKSLVYIPITYSILSLSIYIYMLELASKLASLTNC